MNREEDTPKSLVLQHPGAFREKEWSAPFTILPNEVVYDKRLSNAALCLFALCARFTRGKDNVEGIRTPRGGWGKAMGCTDKHARNARKELQAMGMLYSPIQLPGKPLYTRIVGEGKEWNELAQWTRAPIDMWPDPTWSFAMKRLWLVLYSFKRKADDKIWPATKTISIASGFEIRYIRKVLAALEQTGRVYSWTDESNGMRFRELYELTSRPTGRLENT